MMRASGVSMLSRAGQRRVMCSGMQSEIALLEQLLKAQKQRLEDMQKAPPPASDAEGGAKFQVQTFNAISPVGLNNFPKGTR